jgi:excisionase family DNA binding protein
MGRGEGETVTINSGSCVVVVGEYPCAVNQEDRPGKSTTYAPLSLIIDRWRTINTMSELDSPYLSRATVAKLFNVSMRTVDRLKASGDLGFTRVRGQIRFSLHDVVRFLAKNEVSTVA